MSLLCQDSCKSTEVAEEMSLFEIWRAFLTRSSLKPMSIKCCTYKIYKENIKLLIKLDTNYKTYYKHDTQD